MNLSKKNITDKIINIIGNNNIYKDNDNKIIDK